MKTIITIGRQFGSGGHEIGRRLAEQLQIPCYDKELILLAAQKNGMSAEVFSHVDETATNSFLYAVSSGMFPGGMTFPTVNNIPLNDQLFITQTEIIRAKAEEGPCVFVGRCADFVLRQTELPVLNVFVRADLPFRVARIMEAEKCTERAAEDLIAREDKKRSKYYTFYTRNRWGDVDNYDLVINNAKLGAEQSAALIAAYVRAL